jgi:hypothetical protein
MDPMLNNFELTRLNTEKSLILASKLFPHEDTDYSWKRCLCSKKPLFRGNKKHVKLYREIDIESVRVKIARPDCGRGGYFGHYSVAASPSGIINIAENKIKEKKYHTMAMN